MINSNNLNTEDRIVKLLLSSECTIAKMHGILNKESSISLQAVYDAVKSLVSAGVIIKHSTICSLDAGWRIKTALALSDTPDLPAPKEGEVQTFNFSSFSNLDKYWKHVNNLFTKTVPECPIFYYVSHEFWIYQNDRKESQLEFITQNSGNKQKTYILVGGNTVFDKLYKDRFRQYRQIQLEENPNLKRNEHITICGDFVVYTKIPVKFSRAIDEAYLKFNEEIKLDNQLQKIFNSKGSLSLQIRKDKKLAKKLRKRISRDMYVPRHEREVWSLF